MISVVAVCRYPELKAALDKYIKTHPEFKLVECTDRMNIAVQAVIGITPDIVVCETIDGLDSLDIMNAITEYAPNAYCLLCGIPYDFEVLLGLVRSGVGDAIPSPWSEAELRQAMDRFLLRHPAPKPEPEEKQAASLRRALDKKFFEDTVVTDLGADILSDFDAIYVEYHIQFVNGCFQAINLLLDPRPKELNYMDAFIPVLELENLVKEFFAPYCGTLVCYVKDRGITVLMNSAEPIADLKPLCKKFLVLCMGKFPWCEGHNTITIGIGMMSREPKDIPNVVMSSKFANWMRLEGKMGRVLDFSDYEHSYKPKGDYLSQDEISALRRGVQALDEPLCRDVILKMFGRAECAGVFVAIANSVVYVLIDAFNGFKDASLIKNNKYLYPVKNMPPTFEKLDNMSQIRHEILQWVSICIKEQQERTLSREDAAIFAAKQYISAHYTSQLRLDDVAEQVHLTPSYFCMKFHQLTGQTFVEYLTGLRMEQAKEMLKYSGRKIHEISSAVGITDARHFSRIFSRYCGMLPTEYRARETAKREKST